MIYLSVALYLISGMFLAVWLAPTEKALVVWAMVWPLFLLTIVIIYLIAALGAIIDP